MINILRNILSPDKNTNKKYVIACIIFFIIYFIHHIVTLAYSPLPWLDEVGFASLTMSFQKNHTFYENAFGLDGHFPVLIYGPVYFAIQAFITKIFGFSIFTFRITNLLLGYVDLFLAYKICRHLKFSQNIALFTILLIALDPQFNQFLNSGRMDFVSLFLFFSSYLLFTHVNESNRRINILLCLTIGILLAGSALTNPRIIFAFSFYLTYFIYELLTNKFKISWRIIIKYATIAIGFGAIYYLWIHSEFTSISDYIHETFNNTNVQNHIGFKSNVIIYKYNMLFFAYTLICAVILFVKNKGRDQMQLVIFALPAIITFLLLVTGGISGRYYGLVVPFVTIFYVGASVNLYNHFLYKIASFSILAIFLLMFIVKGIYSYATMDQRNTAPYEKAIFTCIPQNASVAADFQYYYMMMDDHCDYQALEQEGDIDKRINYFAKNKYGYVIININNPNKSLYEKTFLKDKYKLIASIALKKANPFFHKIITSLPYKISENYDCCIYKYIGNPAQ